MKFNPEDGQDFGPHCRNCHKGSSNCGTCHSSGKEARAIGPVGSRVDATAAQSAASYADYITTKAGTQGVSVLDAQFISTSYDALTGTYVGSATNFVPDTTYAGFMKTSRTANWDVDWRTQTGKVNMGQTMTENGVAGTVSAAAACSDDGFSWPHRTLGWKMLKDDLFGLNFDGTTIKAGQARLAAAPANWDASNAAKVAGLLSKPAHDIDSVCLDCHNPTVWGATSTSTHTDAAGSAADDNNDELLLRGLP